LAFQLFQLQTQTMAAYLIFKLTWTSAVSAVLNASWELRTVLNENT
jgi:hypothetical protein